MNSRAIHPSTSCARDVRYEPIARITYTRDENPTYRAPERLGGAEAALRVAARLRLFVRATSLGGTESLVEHRVSVEGPGSLAPPRLLRLSVGLEDAGDLARDLEQALALEGV